MTREQLKQILKDGRKVIRWVKSGVVEVAFMNRQNEVMVQNVLTGYKYNIPKRYNELNIEIVTDSHITLGSLVPKNMR